MGLVRVLSGDVIANNSSLRGPLLTTGVPLSVVDWCSEQGSSSVRLQLPETHNVMIYVYKGEVAIGDQVASQGQMALLTGGELTELHTKQASGVLVLSGQPIDEPVVHYGPFVMNSLQEIEQAIKDYNDGVFESY